ncbi:MAG: hypothetical protein QNI92_03365 [Desulfobacterales bacterium]|nr:hypothetical protein [Desulfobacterales bacterium]
MANLPNWKQMAALPQKRVSEGIYLIAATSAAALIRTPKTLSKRPFALNSDRSG